MSDPEPDPSSDAAYTAFLRKANSHVPPTQNQSKSGAHLLPATTLYLHSETDEPWLSFEQEASRVDTAEEFAALVGEQGESSWISPGFDPQYERVVGSLLQAPRAKSASATGSRPADVQLIEIKQGTRIAVFCVIYDETAKTYTGLRSFKIES